MRDDQAVEVESTELLRTLIRNACVNDGSPSSGQEAKSVDALEDFFAGSGLALERSDVRAHGKDERIGIESFYKGVDFYYRYLKVLTSAP